MLKRHYPWCLDEADGIREIFTAYTARKRRQNVLDYDDLLLFWKALAWSEATREPLASMFDHILVDEYQDTNALQADILEGMRPPGTRATSPWWATTRSRSTRSAPRRSATSWSSRSGSPAPR